MRTHLRLVAFASAFVVTSVTAFTLSAAPASAAPFTYVSVSTGYHRTCAVTTDGKGLCWGWNRSGSLGTADPSSTVLAPSIVALPAGERFRHIEAGQYFSSCGLTESGNVYCWGESGPPGRLLLPTDTVVTQVSVGASQVCALTSERHLYCHGDWNSGELGVGDAEYTHLPVRVVLPDDSTPAYVSAGIGFTCVVTTTGSAYCSGVNAAGQLGNGSTGNSKTFVRVALPDHVALTSISAGLERACAVDTTGAGWCWGENYYGAFGDDTYADSRTPRRVALDDATALADLQTGWYHTCGITTTGTTLCWGSNDQGSLGWGQSYGGKTIRTAALPDGVIARQLEVGLAGTCITSSDSRVYCWGANLHGSVGNGSATPVYSPTEVLRVGTPDPGTPEVTSTSTHSATVTGSFVPNGAVTTLTLLVSPDVGMTGARSVPVVVPRSQQSTSSQLFMPVSYFATVFDLRPATTYFVVVRARNSFGSSDSPVASFTTLGGLPTITSIGSFNVEGDTASLDAVVDANLLDTTVTATYAPDPEFATGVVTTTLGVAHGDSDTTLSGTLTQLSPRTTYWARISASNEAGTVTSDVIEFTTVGDAPSELVAVATGGRRSASLAVSLDAGQLRTTITVAYRAEASRDSWMTQSLGVTGGTSSADFRFTNLAPAATYEVQVSAVNAAGMAEPALLSFTTSGGAPATDDPSVSDVGETTATLRTVVDSNDFATRVTVQIDSDESFSNYDEWFAGALTAGSSSTISLDVSELVDSTTYFARFVATNSHGVTTSETIPFTTSTPVGKLLKRRLDPVDPVPVVEPTTVTNPPPTLVSETTIRIAASALKGFAKSSARFGPKSTAKKPSKKIAARKTTKRTVARKRTVVG